MKKSSATVKEVAKFMVILGGATIGAMAGLLASAPLARSIDTVSFDGEEPEKKEED